MQNEKTLQQMIQEYEAQMPPDIMNIIKGFDWKKQVRMIVSQNQLLLDVGADLEESVYLMILGIADIEEVFDRMMTVHELPQDKVQKILLEVEKQIFEPMHSQLAKLEPSEDKAKPLSSPVPPVDTASSQSSALEPKKQDNPHVIPQAHSASTPNSSTPVNSALSTPISNSVPKSSGIREPFSIKNDIDTGSKDMNVNNPVQDDDIKIDVDSMDTLDPIAMNLKQTTMSQPENVSVPQKQEQSPAEKKYAVDPYREPIE